MSSEQFHKVIALDKKTSIIEDRLKNLVGVNDKVIIKKSDIIDFQMKKVDCFYSSLTLSFLRKKDFYTLWNDINTQLDKQTIIGINIFGDRDEWYRDTEDMTFMNKNEFQSLFSSLEILEFSENERIGTCMGTNGLRKSKKWHIFECIAKL